MDALKNIGAISTGGAENYIAGSQCIETFRVNIRGETLLVEAETYVGLSIKGPKKIVQHIQELVTKTNGTSLVANKQPV